MRRFWLAATCALALLPALRADPSAKPKLAVLIVFDQMRGDYLTRWNDLFTADGFRRMETQGAWFDNCHYPYAMTATGPGHASMLSGCSGDKHGIVANTWYDRSTGAAINCATSDRYERLPPAPKAPKTVESKKDKEEPEEPKAKGVGAPVWMLAPTLGDSLKEATHGRGKVFGLSLKDRSALLPAGQHPDGCYWFDKGQFITTTYYRDRLHPWVAKFNESKTFDRWVGTFWERLRPDLDYLRFSGPDDVPGEDKAAAAGNITFPHALGKTANVNAEYYTALANSPFANQVLLELARLAVIEEKLGQRDVPDLLIVSFSSTDLVGHIYGPDSQEVLDVTLRADLIVRDFLGFLDTQVGKGNYVIGLTADHGVCPLPEVTGKGVQRVIARTLFIEAEMHLREVFGETGDTKSRWIETANEAGIYLNERLIKARSKSIDAVAEELAGWLRKKPFIHSAYTRPQLQGEPSDEIAKMVKKGYRPERSGDVLWVPKPYSLVSSRKAGTSHGTPHPYDTHVPLLFYGAGIKTGRRNDRVTPQALAATLAKALGIAAPKMAEAPVPSGLFE